MERLLMKVTKKLLLLTVGATLLFSATEAAARGINCRKNPDGCERQIAGLVNALKAERAKNSEAAPVEAADENAAPTELERELTSLQQRIENTKEVLKNQGLAKGMKKVRTYTARILSRAEGALTNAEKGSAAYSELESIRARAKNALDVLDNLKGRRVSKKEIKAAQAKLSKIFDRMSTRASKAQGDEGEEVFEF